MAAGARFRLFGYVAEVPPTPPAGHATIFYDEDSKHLKQIDDTGFVTDLVTPAGNLHVERQVVLRGTSFTDQPGTDTLDTDTPLQLEFGPAQNGPTDPVESDALGNFLVNEANNYHFRLSAQYGREGASGTSWIWFRVLVQGVQAGISVVAKAANADSDLPYQAELTADLPAGVTFTVEIWRGSEGNESGGLVSLDPALAGANASASADIIISRYTIEQV